MVWVIRSPARLCLAADHTDYHTWFSPELLTVASADAVMSAVVAPLEEMVIRLHSTDARFDSVDISFDGGPEHGVDWLAWLDERGVPEPAWSNYVEGVLRHAQALYGDDVRYGFEMLVDSTIPVASGASSSSALTMCAALALRFANRLPLDAASMAAETADAEWFVGTRGGMMDHATMVFGEPERALRLAFRPFSAEAVPLDLGDARLVTVFTHPSDKGGEIRRAFNELALVAREVAPALLAEKGFESTGEPIDPVLLGAPRQASLNELFASFPELAERVMARYPLLAESPDAPIQIADRILFAQHEWVRSRRMMPLIRGGDVGGIGRMMDEAWSEAATLYGIRTAGMDAVAEVVRSVTGVHGLKVMGAGFGGNLLALVESDAVEELRSALDSAREAGMVCGRLQVHGAGMGLHAVDILPDDCVIQSHGGLAAIVLCGGRGSRVEQQGIETHKPLLPIDGVPSTKLVLDRLRAALGFDQVFVVVPPERLQEYRAAIDDSAVQVVVQRRALGTGDAVHVVLGELADDIDHVLVTFGSQPLVRRQTLRASLRHHLEGEYWMTLPTTRVANPYAPLVRDADGRVTGSLETHLDGVQPPEFGETNIGAYWVCRAALDDTLRELRGRKWDVKRRRYRTKSGELGFPNEMVAALIDDGRAVDGLAIGDPEEVLGIKTPEHLAHIEAVEARRRRWD